MTSRRGFGGSATSGSAARQPRRRRWRGKGGRGNGSHLVISSMDVHARGALYFFYLEEVKE